MRRQFGSISAEVARGAHVAEVYAGDVPLHRVASVEACDRLIDFWRRQHLAPCRVDIVAALDFIRAKLAERSS